jgi:hypothetical protein
MPGRPSRARLDRLLRVSDERPLARLGLREFQLEENVARDAFSGPSGAGEAPVAFDHAGVNTMRA